jgi:hypothetical protein
MKVSPQLLLVVIGILALLGCRATAPASGSRDLAEVRITSHPQSWGYAYKVVKPDGSITGGHLSGGAEEPRIYESSSHITEQDMSTLRNLVATIAADAADTEPSWPDQKLEGWTSVVISFGDGTSTTVFAKMGQQFQLDAMAIIWDTISKYDAGAW